MTDREQLNERYLEAQLRGELGIDPDLSESVLRRVYGKPRRVIPGPRRAPRWRPLAAAAVVLIAAGFATYALVSILPGRLGNPERAAQRPAEPLPVAQPEPQPLPEQPAQPDPEQEIDEPNQKSQPEVPDEAEAEPEKPEPEVTEPEPDGTAIEGPVERPLPDRGWTDPPGAWPDPRKPVVPDPTVPKERAVIAANWEGDGLRVTRDGRVLKWKTLLDGALVEGDRVETKGAVELILADGALIRVDGEFTCGLYDKSVMLTLHDGAAYADTTAPVVFATAEVRAHCTGVVVAEQRLHGLDLYCISGGVDANGNKLGAGFMARLEKDGFGREKAITWADVQRDFRFLKDTPARAMLIEDLNSAPGELFGGKLAEGVLAGDVDSDTGIGFYLREPYEFREGDVVRFRIRVEKACEMILQFGTVSEGNWRHKMGGVKAGEWIDYELPLADLYKTTDVARKAAPGLKLKFFQLHPEETKARIEIDRVEIVHRP